MTCKVCGRKKSRFYKKKIVKEDRLRGFSELGSGIIKGWNYSCFNSIRKRFCILIRYTFIWILIRLHWITFVSSFYSNNENTFYYLLFIYKFIILKFYNVYKLHFFYKLLRLMWLNYSHVTIDCSLTCNISKVNFIVCIVSRTFYCWLLIDNTNTDIWITLSIFKDQLLFFLLHKYNYVRFVSIFT